MRNSEAQDVKHIEDAAIRERALVEALRRSADLLGLEDPSIFFNENKSAEKLEDPPQIDVADVVEYARKLAFTTKKPRAWRFDSGVELPRPYKAPAPQLSEIRKSKLVGVEITTSRPKRQKISSATATEPTAPTTTEQPKSVAAPIIITAKSTEQIAKKPKKAFTFGIDATSDDSESE